MRKAQGLVSKFLGYAQATHFGPTVLVVTISFLLSRREFSTVDSLRISAAIFAGQCVVGWSNDLVDCELDSAAQRMNKPLVAGKISSSELVRAIYLFLALATGTSANIKKLWGWFGVYTKKIPNEDGDSVDWQTGKKITYDIQHDDVVILLGPNSHYRWIDLGNPAVSNPTELPAQLKRFLSDQGRLNLLKPQQPDWTVNAVYGALQEVFHLPIGPKMRM